MGEQGAVRRSWSLSSFIAGVAVALVVGGTAFAAGQITGKDVKNSSLTGKDVKNKTLTKADFKGAVAGSQGAQGIQGPTGPTGPLGTAGGSLAGSYPNPTIAAGSVGSSQLATGAIPHDGTGSDGSTKLATNSVNYNEIGNGAVHGANFKSSGTYTEDFGSMSANSCQVDSHVVGTASDVDTNDFVLGTPQNPSYASTQLTAFLFDGSTDGSIAVKVCNPFSYSTDPPAITFNYLVIEN